MIYEAVTIGEYRVEVLNRGCCFEWHITGKPDSLGRVELDKCSGRLYSDPEYCLSDGIRYAEELGSKSACNEEER